MYQSTFKDAGDVCRIVIDTGDSVGSEELEDGAIVNAEGGDVEAFEEELSGVFVRGCDIGSGGLGRTGNPLRGRRS